MSKKVRQQTQEEYDELLEQALTYAHQLASVRRINLNKLIEAQRKALIIHNAKSLKESCYRCVYREEKICGFYGFDFKYLKDMKASTCDKFFRGYGK